MPCVSAFASPAFFRRVGALAGAAALSAIAGCPPSAPAPAGAPTLAPDDHALAVGTPTLTVFEYGDFECGVCGRFFRETYPTIKARFIDTGLVRWVFRNYPISFTHPHAKGAAIAAECAGAEGKFFEYHDLLFANQAALTFDDLSNYAAQVGLADFDACVTSTAAAAAVDADLAEARARGVPATPTFYFADQVIVGFVSAEEFAAKLEAALE